MKTGSLAGLFWNTGPLMLPEPCLLGETEFIMSWIESTPVFSPNDMKSAKKLIELVSRSPKVLPSMCRFVIFPKSLAVKC